MESKRRVGVLVATALIVAALVVGICLTGGSGGEEESIQVTMRDAVLHETNRIALFGLAGMAREVFHLVEGRYTMRVLAADLGCAVVSALLACLIFLGKDLMNPTFLRVMENLGMNDVVMTFFGNFQVFLLGVILFALALDAVDSAVKVLRVYRNRS